MNRDPFREDVERFLLQSPTIASRVGGVESMTMVRLIIMQAGDVSRSGREYEYVVKGARSKVRAVVVLDTDNRSPPSVPMQLHSVEDALY